MRIPRVLYTIFAFFIAAACGLAFSQPVHAQGFEVSGQVTSAEDGSGLPGVNIVVRGTTVGTTTDAAGEYTVEAPSPQDSLIFSFVGYERRVEPINGRSEIDVSLQPSTQQLGDVVVVGYGELGRESVTGAISEVSGDDIADVPVTSPAEALQGRTPGLTVAGDAPGEEPQVRIRGLTTPNTNSPLYVVDGVPVSRLVGLNSNNIESIEVLKDASAASIYGSRAAGGVILITTKQGSRTAEGIQTSFNSYVGLQQPWKTIDLLNTQQYVQAWSSIAEGEEEPPRLDQLGGNEDSYDYQEEVFRTAPIMNYDLAFSGGGETAQYRVSLGYLSQDGIILNTGYDNYSLSVNTDFDLGRFRIGESLSLAHFVRSNVRNSGGRSILEHLTKFAPYLQPRDEDNPDSYNGPDQIDDNDAENPVRVQELGTNERQETRVVGNVHGEVDLLEGLYFRSVLGGEAYFGNDYAFTPSFQDGEFHGLQDAQISELRTTFFSPITTNTFNYDQNLGVHTFNAVAGFEAQLSLFRSAGAQGINSLSDNLQLPGTVEDDIALGSKTRDVLLSYFGRLNYNYDGRYLIQGSLRRDGYSRFGPENRFGIFPSVSLGWNIANESFMEDSGFDILKLRGSWGEVGNNNAVGAYETQSTVNTDYFYVDADGSLVPAATIPGLANQALKWETTRMTNVGVDIAGWNNALNFSAEYYNNTTQDVLLTVPLPGSFGFIVDPRFNTGDVQTDGFEFSLGYSGQRGDFGWDVSANFGTSNNEVTRLGLGSPLGGAQYAGPGHTITRVEEGEPLYFFYGHKVDRLYQESDFNSDGTLKEGLPTPSAAAAPGDIKFVDVNGDGEVDSDDRTNIGDPIPDYTYGLNTRLNWKAFDLSFFLQGAGGHQIYRAWAYWTEGMTRVFNAETTVLDRWTPQNTDTDVPRGVIGDPHGNARPSERWVEDGDYLRLKLITIGYTVPSSLTGLQRLRIYVQSQNALTFTGYDGYDPEVGVWSDDPGNFTSDYGVDFGQMPQARSFTFGVQLNI